MHFRSVSVTRPSTAAIFKANGAMRSNGLTANTSIGVLMNFGMTVTRLPVASLKNRLTPITAPPESTAAATTQPTERYSGAESTNPSNPWGAKKVVATTVVCSSSTCTNSAKNLIIGQLIFHAQGAVGILANR